jgi:hypothetical protein
MTDTFEIATKLKSMAYGKSSADCSPTPCSAEPSWTAFVARMKKEAPTLVPDENDDKWKNLHAVYIMGYAACLDTMRAELDVQID